MNLKEFVSHTPYSIHFTATYKEGTFKNHFEFTLAMIHGKSRKTNGKYKRSTSLSANAVTKGLVGQEDISCVWSVEDKMETSEILKSVDLSKLGSIAIFNLLLVAVILYGIYAIVKVHHETIRKFMEKDK